MHAAKLPVSIIWSNQLPSWLAQYEKVKIFTGQKISLKGARSSGKVWGEENQFDITQISGLLLHAWIGVSGGNLSFLLLELGDDKG